MCKNKTISQKLTKAIDEKTDQNRVGEIERRSDFMLEKILALMSACVNVGGERQNTVTLLVWRSKEEEVGEVKQNREEEEEVGFSLTRRR